MDDKNSSTSDATEAVAPSERANRADEGGAVAGGAKCFSVKCKLAAVQRLTHPHQSAGVRYKIFR